MANGIMKKGAMGGASAGVEDGLSSVSSMGGVLPRGRTGSSGNWMSQLNDGSVSQFPETVQALKDVNTRKNNDPVY